MQQALPGLGIDMLRQSHEAAVRHGATDIGKPGARREYSGNYYAAFVHDPDGNNVEAVSTAPEPAGGNEVEPASS